MRRPSLPLTVLLYLTCAAAVATSAVAAPDHSDRPHTCLLQRQARPLGARAAAGIPEDAGSRHPMRHELVADTEPDVYLGVSSRLSAPASRATLEFIQSSLSPEATALLRAHEPWVINAVVCAVLLAVALPTCLGCLAGGRWWVPAMVAASYAVLVPGLVSKDFSFNIALVLGGRQEITRPRGEPRPIRESTRSMVGLLWGSGSHTGAVLIALFAFVTPLAKLLLLGVGELWRHSSDPWRVKMSRRSFLAVQLTSKWASPDMFAFALLYYLLRSLHHPPFLESLQVLDVGFTCYNVFCVSSVLSTLAVTLPRVVDDAPAVAGEVAKDVHCAARFPGTVTVVLTAAWLVLFFQGIFSPAIAMSLDLDLLMDKMDLPGGLANVAQAFHLEDLVDTKVSIWHAATMLYSWFRLDGQLNLLLGAVMLGGFAVALTVVDMLLLLAAAIASSVGGPRFAALAAHALHVAHAAKHLAMLDVCAVGVVVVSFAAGIYKEQGIVIAVMPGIPYALASEVLHYLTFRFVSQTVELAEAGKGL